MMLDIFSSFDMNCYNTMGSLSSTVWVMSFFFLIFCLNSKVWSRLSFSDSLLKMVISFMYGVVKRVQGGYFSGFSLSVCSLFFLMVWMNMNNIVPFFFPLMCHLPLPMFFACFFWGILVVSSLLNSWEQVVAMAVPLGCPLILSPLMVLLETIASIVRPITLTMRVVFNLAGGQVILGLIAELDKNLGLLYGVKFKGLAMLVIILVVVLGLIGFFAFEVGIGLLQSYIYCMLLCMYSEDHSMWYDINKQ
uniref:ATP synthase subunit a n=1 Tax=Brachidontes exustus TaxID=40254 RepID=A0A0U1V5X0_BRAEX|nr:ATP synthase F0 subunit 6 [Brachidontes exustus]AIM58701.1 ATP synthase F0 subunit 6 [Brachidontes exustus]